MALVSVVITTHKRKPDIVERALKSILNQTHSRIEIFVVDDSPQDYEYRKEVEKMVEKYADQNVKYLPHVECKGACAARNTGLNAASGEYIAFLDDDDEWKPQKIEKQLQKFTDESIALVYCGSEILNDSTGVVQYPVLRRESGNIYDKLILNNFIGSTSFPLLRTSSLRSIGGFDVLMQSAQDADVWLRLAEKFEVNYVDESLVIYHVHDGERISTNFQKKINGLERLNQKHINYLKSNKAAMWIRTIKLCPMYAGNGQLFKALGIWFKCSWLRPIKVGTNLEYLYSTIATYVFANIVRK